MSLIICPECGTKISDKATTCPHCGFVSENVLVPISQQNLQCTVPKFKFELKGWNPQRERSYILPYEDNKKLVAFFGVFENLQRYAPSIADVIQKMATKEKVLVADIEPYIQKLINEGKYKIGIDKKGALLPTIRNSKNTIVKQVRLKEVIQDRNVLPSIQNLQSQALMTQMLDQIEYVGSSIKELHIEMQNDRLALAESSWDKLNQAMLIEDSRLREVAILNAINSATDAKKILMKNFSANLQFFTEHSGQSGISQFFDKTKSEDLRTRASDSFNALAAITNVVQVECEGYAALGEYDASKKCLEQFNAFIKDNKLTTRDTLLLINEHSDSDQINLVDKFNAVSENISGYISSGKMKYKFISLESEGKNNGKEAKVKAQPGERKKLESNKKTKEKEE